MGGGYEGTREGVWRHEGDGEEGGVGVGVGVCVYVPLPVLLSLSLSRSLLFFCRSEAYMASLRLCA